MAGFEEAARLLERRMKDYWTDTVVAYENAGEFKAPERNPFCRFFVRETGSRQTGMGVTKLVRNDGLLEVQVFTPRNRGTRQARALADKIAALFDLQKFGDRLQCRVASVTILPQRMGESFQQINVSVPYYHHTDAP
jgi:hypothetical protein